MNIDIHNMLIRQREQDLLREAAQARLARVAMPRRAPLGGALRAALDNLFIAIGRLKALANAG